MNERVVGRLRRAFQENRLTLFLGAGCSLASGVPDWEGLVRILYLNGIGMKLKPRRRSPTHSFLVESIVRADFARRVAPLDVAARGLHEYYKSEEDFLRMMRWGLYRLTKPLEIIPRRISRAARLLENNGTLRAISTLCARSSPGRRGIRAVITYNYDDLLEKTLHGYPFQSLWKPASLDAHRLPIYHVHGFLPTGKKRHGSRLEELLLSEDQYHKAAQAPYSWSTMVQIQELSNSVSLMLGLSITDPDLRRVLDALRDIPRRGETYAVMLRPAPADVLHSDVDSIVESANDLVRKANERGYELITNVNRPGIRKTIIKMLVKIEELNLHHQEKLLNDLGVRLIWVDKHEDIEDLAAHLVRAPRRPGTRSRQRRRVRLRT